MIDVRKLKENNKKEIAEVAKYTVKESDYLIRDEFDNIDKESTDEVVKTLDNALHRKRLISLGFKFKEVHKL